MKSPLLYAALLLAVSAGLGSADDGNDYSRVRAEIEQLKAPHPWAGEYSGSIRLMSLAPSGRYCVTLESDMLTGTVSGNCGRLRLEGDWFVADDGPLEWEKSDDNGPPYLRVPWGEMSYLIPERRLLDFVNAVNAGDEPGYGSRIAVGFVRSSEVEPLAAGEPALPAEFRALLRMKPLVATAVAVSSRTKTISRFEGVGDDISIEKCASEGRFDIGAASGAFVGMELHAQSADELARVRLASVDAQSSSGLIEQEDCADRDLIPAGTRFATRRRWNIRAVLSTQPLHIDIRYASAKRYPAFYEGTLEELDGKNPFSGAAAAGFGWEKIADVTFSGTFGGSLELRQSKARRDRTLLSIGGNAVIRADRSDAVKKEEDGIEIRRFAVYRLSYRGQAINPASEFALSLRRSSKGGYDWPGALLGIQAAACGAAPASRDAHRAAALDVLHWDEETLRRAADLRFEDLRPDQRAAAEALIPEPLRSGYVWPALADARSRLQQAVWEAGWAAEKKFEAAHPGKTAECQALGNAIWKRLVK